MRLEPPARALQNALRVQSYEALIEVIKLFKNVTLTPLSHPPFGVTDTKALHAPSPETGLSYFVFCKNWYKYQGESSRERMRKMRHKRTVTKYVSSDALEKSRVDLTSTSTSLARDASLEAPRPLNTGKHQEIKTYDQAGDNELCGPPKDFSKKLKLDRLRITTD